LADQAPEAIRARDLLLQEPETAPHLHAVEQALHDQLELVVVEGLRDVVGGAQLHRLDGDLLRAEGGDHDDRRLRRALAHPAQHLHAAPTPGAATIVPPWASTAWRAIARPRPVPLCLVEKKGSKRRGSASARTPGPLSVTERLAPTSPLRTATVTRRGEGDVASASRAF